jgi:hypothetical protein
MRCNIKDEVPAYLYYLRKFKRDLGKRNFIEISKVGRPGKRDHMNRPLRLQNTFEC